MSLEKKCSECSVIIVDEWFLSCNGFMCNKVISYNCAMNNAKKLMNKFPSEIKKALKIIMDGVQGLRWFCPDCRDSTNSINSIIDQAINRFKSDDASPHDSAIPPTKVTKQGDDTAECHRITRSKTKASLIEHSAKGQSSSCDQTPQQIENRKTSAINIPSNPSQLRLEIHKPCDNFTRVCDLSESLFTKDSTESHSKITISESVIEPVLNIIEDLSIRVVQPRRWLFVSRIHSSVTDVSFKKLCDKVININDIYTQRITPKSSNGMQYDYISYKINIPGDSFNYALNSELWPAGLLVKEFEWGQKKSFFQKLRLNHKPQ